MTDYYANHSVNIFYSDEDQGFIATVPDLPGCSAFGKTRGAAVEEVIFAMMAWAEAAKAAGNPIPPVSKHLSPARVKPDTDRQIFFYEQDFYVLSNFSSFRLKWIGIDFDTSEHAYHFLKFRMPFAACTVEQRRLRGDIMHARSAHDAFKIAEKNKHLRRPDWDDVKVDTMRNLIRAKAEQHEYVRRKLLASGDRELIEDSWRDDFWGWGPHRTGQNMLGKLWMEVRSELIAVTASLSSAASNGENK